jgi:hypothetical protein
MNSHRLEVTLDQNCTNDLDSNDITAVIPNVVLIALLASMTSVLVLIIIAMIV